MVRAKQIIFRRITGADFFNIYNAPSSEEGGGKQSYIDVNTSGVSLKEWHKFFDGITPTIHAQNRPAWKVTIASLGLGKSQVVRIAQRRPTSVAIREQKLASRQSNRIFAWDPRSTEFPEPSRHLRSANDPEVGPLIDGLVVYLLRDTTGNFWAGWFKSAKPRSEWVVTDQLARMFSEPDGFISLNPGIEIDENDLTWPFGRRVHGAAPSGNATPPGPSLGDRSTRVPQTEDQLTRSLFDSDEMVVDSPPLHEKIARVRIRNTAAAKLLKKLYRGKCQITGDDFVFDKVDGTPYTEVHHLVPLGKGGFDSPLNLIVVSAHMHRMLHYAKVSTIDLRQIKEDKLDLWINGVKYTIRWHPKHASSVLVALRKTL